VLMGSESDERYKAALDVAVQMYVYEGELIWSRFNSMLVANSVLVAIIGFSYLSTVPLASSPVVTFGAPLAGLVVTVAWWRLTDIGNGHLENWLQARKELLAGYFRDHPANGVMDCVAETARPKGKPPWPRAHHIQHVVTSVFLLLYVAFLLNRWFSGQTVLAVVATLAIIAVGAVAVSRTLPIPASSKSRPGERFLSVLITSALVVVIVANLFVVAAIVRIGLRLLLALPR